MKKSAIDLMCIFIMLLCLFTHDSAAYENYGDKDIAALENLRKSFPENTSFFDSWCTDEPDGWKGIGWDSSLPRRVVSLDLRGANLEGSLDVTAFSALKFLICSSNHLTNLKISGLSRLEHLFCDWNKLVSLDATELPSLISLNCVGNAIEELKLDGLQSLKRLNCGSNYLTNLDLKDLSSLSELKCNANRLTSLDLSKNVMLTSLHCSLNELKELKSRELSRLTEVYCNNNLLTELNLSEASDLKAFVCVSNPLKKIDLTKTTKFEGFLTMPEKSKLTLLTSFENWVIAFPAQSSALSIIQNCPLVLEAYQDFPRIFVATKKNKSYESSLSICIPPSQPFLQTLLGQEIIWDDPEPGREGFTPESAIIGKLSKEVDVSALTSNDAMSITITPPEIFEETFRGYFPSSHSNVLVRKHSMEKPGKEIFLEPGKNLIQFSVSLTMERLFKGPQRSRRDTPEMVTLRRYYNVMIIPSERRLVITCTKDLEETSALCKNSSTTPPAATPCAILALTENRWITPISNSIYNP